MTFFRFIRYWIFAAVLGSVWGWIFWDCLRAYFQTRQIQQVLWMVA